MTREEEIIYEMDNVLTIPDFAMGPITKTLALLPEEVTDFIINNFTFLVAGDETETGSCWHFEDCCFLNKKGFILLNHNLWSKTEIEISQTIAHEVAHAFLGHKKFTDSDFDIVASIEREKEADNQAIEWLSKHYSKEDLVKNAVYLQGF